MTDFKQLQQAARLTNYDAAELLGVSERTITRYRAGHDVPAKIMQELHTIAASQVDKEIWTLDKSQRDTLIDVACGLQNKQIANKCGVTRRTIDYYLSEARRKLQSKTTAQAVARSIKMGIIKPSEIAIICFLCLGGVDNDAMRTNRTQPRPPSVRVHRREDVV